MLKGFATSGKTQVRPIVAPEGHWEFDVLDVLGIDELNNVTMSEVFPNPASAITCVPVSSNSAQEGSITLRDITGKVIQIIHEGTIPMGRVQILLSCT